MMIIDKSLVQTSLISNPIVFINQLVKSYLHETCKIIFIDHIDVTT